MDAAQPTADAGKTVVIVMTSGPSTPQRCATPFFIGMLLASMDAEVSLFFTMEGVLLTRRGVADRLVAAPGGKSIMRFIREAKEAGVKLYLCRPAMPGYEILDDEVIDEIDEVSSGGVLAEMILSCDKVLFF
ncbi:MAG TPA: DsrE family protein [Rhodocyclaceae bacterium]|nr:DsrE family protein [Rhodocyclaceae bacterium]